MCLGLLINFFQDFVNRKFEKMWRCFISILYWTYFIASQNCPFESAFLWSVKLIGLLNPFKGNNSTHIETSQLIWSACKSIEWFLYELNISFHWIRSVTFLAPLSLRKKWSSSSEIFNGKLQFLCSVNSRYLRGTTYESLHKNCSFPL